MIDERTRREVAASDGTAPDDEALERLYVPYTLRGRRYVLALVYTTDPWLDRNAARFPSLRASGPVPAACSTTDGGGPVFEETYVVGAPESAGARAAASETKLEATAKELASCAGESGVSWQTACAGYQPPEDGTILYADPCAWYYEASPRNVVAPGRYDSAALAEARKLVRTPEDPLDRLELLSGLSDLCKRRCTRTARAEIWDLRATVAREMGWQDGARHALAEAASLREERTSREAP